MDSEKSNLRKKIEKLKKQFTQEDFILMSDEVFAVLEITGAFQDSKNILIYNSMPDEVSTQNFIKKWKNDKNFILPIVSGNELKLHKLNDKTEFKTSPFGIEEPIGENFTDYAKIDLIIVPGVAFDRKCNRLGRGKGYYDRFLPKTNATTIGVCFDFQLFDHIIAGEEDVRMNIIVSENDLIW